MKGLNDTASAVRRHAERLIELTEWEKKKSRPEESLEPSGPRKATVEAMREVRCLRYEIKSPYLWFKLTEYPTVFPFLNLNFA